MIKVLVLHPKPKDPDHFRRHYRDVHIPIAAKMPGMVSCHYSFDVRPFGPAERQPVFCAFEIVFPDKQTMENAFRSEIGKQVLEDVPNFATGGTPQVMVYELIEAKPQ